MQARFADALELLQRAREDSNGHDHLQCYVSVQEAVLALDQGRVADAIPSLVVLSQSCQENSLLLEVLNLLAWHVYIQGSWSHALDFFRQASSKGVFNEGGQNLQLAIGFAGLAAAQLRLQADTTDMMHSAVRAEAYLTPFGDKEIDGLQIAYYLLAACKSYMGLSKEADRLLACATKVQKALYSASHPAGTRVWFCLPSGNISTC